MASQRQIHVGGVPIGGGAPVAVQTMTKTETADVAATLAQIERVAQAGADLVRVAVPRREDADALGEIVARSPIPVIADIHFNYTLALRALDAGAHCVRLNPGNIGGPDKVAQVVARAKELGTPLRIGVNSGSLPEHLRELEYTNPVEALVAAATGFVELMERLQFTNFKVSMKSTSVPDTIASNRMLAERIPYPLHLGVTEAGTKWSGSLKSAVGLGTLLADGIGDTIRISLSTFHAEEEVKVAWEILKALKLRERGPVLIACPTCGRLQFDMDTIVAEVERRLADYDEPIEVSVLGCAVNGIGEARHADFGITGAKDAGAIYAKGRMLRKVPTERLVDELFAEIDRYYAAGRRVIRDERAAAEAERWLAEHEDETALTPERLAALEAAAAREQQAAGTEGREHHGRGAEGADSGGPGADGAEPGGRGEDGEAAGSARAGEEAAGARRARVAGRRFTRA
ncbi:MAG TPA: flavodoxin-dependent (E)-4-hydroxy-3-methylbut-2-enyl-diphosphate synthase [Solirubrobacteraceae bacterium]|nr:flavodoxin-dependent (E)-4-hydroxy-3-methylbut-2-enyl-diphosphate synthase [Solirubrobacteraceae bacterium]